MKLASLAAALAAALVLPASLTALAQANTPRIDQREANQDARIQNGQQSGALTPAEDTHLQAGQAHVQNMEAKAKSDGKVTARERARITRAQNAQSRRIFRKKHNARTTAPAT